MILHHVAQAAGALIEGATPFHAEGLGQRDLHARHLVAVPDRLQERIGKAEIEDVHDRFLAEKVINAEDIVFGKQLARHAVELARRGQIAAERFLDDDARLPGKTRRAESPDDDREQCRRNRQVIGRALCVCQRLPERVEGALVVVIAAHILQQRQQPLKRLRLNDGTVVPDAVRHTRTQLLDVPCRRGDADHRHGQRARLAHGIKRRKDLLIGQISGDAKQHQRVGWHQNALGRVGPVKPQIKAVHQVGPPAFSTWPPNSCRIADCTRLAKSAWPREPKRA